MKVLLIELMNWSNSALVPRGLSRTGFEVAVMSPPGNFIRKSSYLHQTFDVPKDYRFEELFPFVEDAIKQTRPALVLPLDSGSLDVLLGMVDHYRSFDPQSEVLDHVRQALVREDLVPHMLSKRMSRIVAEEVGIRVPEYREVLSPGAATEFAQSMANSHGSSAIVLKADRGGGGDAVRICTTEEAIRESFESLTELAKTKALSYPYLIAERFIEGVSVIHTFSALKGKMLAGFSVDIIARRFRTTPCTVIQSSRYPEVEEAARRMCAGWVFNGFGSIDFEVDSVTGLAYMLDFNPHPVSVLHVEAVTPQDPFRALFSELAGLSPPPVRELDSGHPVALFPQELNRDPSSPYFAYGHDVPWDEPELLYALARGRSVAGPIRRPHAE